MGFGFQPGFGGSDPLLAGKQMISFTSSGAPDHWVRDTGALQALTALFDRHVSEMCGLRMVDHVHAGGIVSNITDEAFQDVLQDVRRAVEAHFGGLVRRDAIRTTT
jgi:NAD(P)H dehydrogenase (quinone)